MKRRSKNKPRAQVKSDAGFRKFIAEKKTKEVKPPAGPTDTSEVDYGHPRKARAPRKMSKVDEVHDLLSKGMETEARDRLYDWATNKQVTRAEFTKIVDTFTHRAHRMGWRQGMSELEWDIDPEAT